jgi:hypothetical protein
MARLTRRFALIAAAIVASAALVACGDGGTSTKDKNAYAEKVNAAQTKFAATVSNVNQESGSQQSISHQRETLGRFQRAIDAVVADLRRIDAPPEVVKEHARLVGVMTDFGRNITQANDALRNPTTTGITQAKQKLASITGSVNARVAAAIAAINVKLKGT